MTGRAHDTAAIRLLTEVATALASVNGPISSGTAATALVALTSIIRSRGTPITMKTLDAITGLIEALREDITQ